MNSDLWRVTKHSYYQCKLKQWIALKVCSDWQLRLRISFVIHLRATHVGFCNRCRIELVKIILLCDIISLLSIN